MPLFHYKKIDKEGKRTEGTLEVKDKFALYRAISQEGGIVVYSKEIENDSKGSSLWKHILAFGTVSQHEKIVFARNFSKMIESGLPITRALSTMEKESKGKFKAVLHSLGESLGKGMTLSDSMKIFPDVFSVLFISMVRAGEESGNLSLALQNISLQLEKSYQLNRKVRGALMYPAVILALMVVIGILMMVYMVPTLTKTFTELKITLPLSTRIIIWTSTFLESNFILTIFGILGAILLFVLFLRTTVGKRITDFFLLHMPIISEMTKQINSARTARTLSSLLMSGIDILIAIDVTKDVIQNSYYKKVIDEIKATIQKGEPISKVFSANQNLYPIYVTEMVSVGEETGKIGDMLSNVATFYEDEIDQKTKDMSSVIEPLLMIFIGAAVGFFALSMISPIYSIGNSIN